MDPGGSDPPRRDLGKQIAEEPPRRRQYRSRDVQINIGNMRQGHTYVGPARTEQIAPRPSSPSGPDFFHLPSHGHFLGPSNMYSAGNMGAPPGHIGSSSGHTGTPPEFFMPTPSPQEDIDPDNQPGQDDTGIEEETVEVVVINGLKLKVIYPCGDA